MRYTNPLLLLLLSLWYIVDIIYCSAVWPTHIFHYRPKSSHWRQCCCRTESILSWFITSCTCPSIFVIITILSIHYFAFSGQTAWLVLGLRLTDQYNIPVYIFIILVLGLSLTFWFFGMYPAMGVALYRRGVVFIVM